MTILWPRFWHVSEWRGRVSESRGHKILKRARFRPVCCFMREGKLLLFWAWAPSPAFAVLLWPLSCVRTFFFHAFHLLATQSFSFFSWQPRGPRNNLAAALHTLLWPRRGMYLCAIFLVNGTHSVHGEPKLSTSANGCRLLGYGSYVVYLRMDTVRLET